MKLATLPKPDKPEGADGTYTQGQLVKYAKECVRRAVLEERRAIDRALAVTTYQPQGAPFQVGGGPFQRAVAADAAKRDKESQK